MSKLSVVALPGSQNIILTREVNAPAALVFKAFTDESLVPKWWGPAHYTTIVEEMDVKPGGVWRYKQSSDDFKVTFHGVYHDVAAPQRLVNTYEFDGMPGHVGIVTTTFEERDGKTLITELSVFPSVEDRDGVIQSGMEGGAAESFDRLDALIRTL